MRNSCVLFGLHCSSINKPASLHILLANFGFPAPFFFWGGVIPSSGQEQLASTWIGSLTVMVSTIWNGLPGEVLHNPYFFLCRRMCKAILFRKDFDWMLKTAWCTEDAIVLFPLFLSSILSLSTVSCLNIIWRSRIWILNMLISKSHTELYFSPRFSYFMSIVLILRTLLWKKARVNKMGFISA